jgi:undecaprenyl-diphosphatase
MAQLIASHALLLLAAGIAALAAGVVVVAALARLAAQHRERLWSWIDLIVPGHLWRPRTYLAVHLAIGFTLVVAIAAFAVIAENVVAAREIAAFDVAFAQALHMETSPAWHTLFWYLTWLGSAPAIATVAGAVVWILARRGLKLLLVMWCVSQAGSALLNYALKVAFTRARPDGADPFLHGGGWSFPSGHAMNTLVLCGVGGYLLLRLSPPRRVPVLALVALFAWALVIGFSRLYLGVHYVSDVIAGFLAGTAWIAVCVSGAEVAMRRRSKLTE